MSQAEKKKKAARQTVRQGKRPTPTAPPRQSVVVKTTEHGLTGMRAFESSRYAIGYLLGGHKRIYIGDNFEELEPGNIYFLERGIHYIEHLPGPDGPFEEIVFYFTSAQIGSIIASLSVNHDADTRVRHSCEVCRNAGHVFENGWPTLTYFFATIDQYMREGFYVNHTAGELIDLGSLIFQIISRPEGCLRTRVLNSSDPEKELMERQIGGYIFSGVTLEEFARANNRSLTSFKKKFKLYFNESPHRWVVRQRLMYARMGLISTSKPVAQIGFECSFPNTSHFIKLFRRQFGITPAQYRRRYFDGAE